MRKLLLSIIILGLFSAAYAGTLSRDSVNAVVTDTTNSIMWQDDTESGDGSNAALWANAITYCEGLTLGGYTNWRLPNINELRSIIDYNEIGYTNAIFENVNTAGQYWSSTTMQDDDSPDNAWTIILWLNGSSFPGAKTGATPDMLDVRCVRPTD